MSELREAYEAARERLFHGTGHLRYGLRQCGPRCLGCSRLKVAMLAAVEAVQRKDKAVLLIQKDIENFPQSRM